jgi:uncharacterized protein (TIGR00251 family)
MSLEGLEIGATANGSRLKVRAKPGARRDAVEGVHDRALKVSVTAAPERGKANESIEKLLSRALGIPRGSVRVVSGLTGRNKVVEIEGLKPAELKKRLEAHGPE